MKNALMPLATVLSLVGMLSSCSEGSKGTIGNESTANNPTISANGSIAANGAATSGSVGNVATRTFDTGPGKPILDAEIQKRHSSSFDDCMSSENAAGGVTSAVMDCNGAEIEQQDARLNQAYKMVMSRLAASEQNQLRASEKAWIKTRDQHCTKAMGDEAGGSLGGIIYSGCILNETIKRTIWLERLG